MHSAHWHAIKGVTHTSRLWLADSVAHTRARALLTGAAQTGSRPPAMPATRARGADNEAPPQQISVNVNQLKEPGYIIYDIETDCSYTIEGTMHLNIDQ